MLNAQFGQNTFESLSVIEISFSRRHNLQSIAFNCIMLQLVAFSCDQLHSVAFCCILLYSVAFSSVLLRSVAFSCIQLYSVAISCVQLQSVEISSSSKLPTASNDAPVDMKNTLFSHVIETELYIT